MAYPAPIISTITIVFYPHRPVTGPGLPGTHRLYHHHCLLPTPLSHWPMAYPAPIVTTITTVSFPHRPLTGPAFSSTHRHYHHHCLLPTPLSHWPCLLQHPSSLPSPLSPSHTAFSLTLPFPASIVSTITSVFRHRRLPTGLPGQYASGTTSWSRRHGLESCDHESQVLVSHPSWSWF